MNSRVLSSPFAIELCCPPLPKRLLEFSRGDLLRQVLCNPWTLLVCKITIGLVSAYDVFLTIKYVDSLPTMELNPIGRWLMMLDRETSCHLSQIAAFIASKFVGNFVALSVIELLAHFKPSMSSAVALSVAAFQLLLLYFLVCGDSF